MKSFITTLKLSLCMLVICICNTACTDNDFNEITTDRQGDAIQVVISGPENYAVSRAASETKQFFVDGDRIHVTIAFTLDGNNTPQKKYACLKYVEDENKWVEDGTTNFKWLWNATSASFTAYFIPKAGNYNNNSKLENNGTVALPLSHLSTNNLDPLKATHTNVAAGGAVYLQFEHLLTKVTLTALKGITIGSKLRISLPELKDQWSIQLKDGQLTENFTEANSFIESTYTDNKVMFLLPPVAEGTQLKLAKRDMSPLHSIQLPEDQALEAGIHYTIDTSTLPDNFIADDLKEQDWNNDAAIKLTPEEIGSYLKGVSEGDDKNGKVFTVERSGKIIDILISYMEDNNRTVIQVRDVDFQNGTFTPPAAVINTVIFNGNGHYIRNVSLSNIIGEDKAIFGENKGSMSNLNIENVTSTDASSETNLGILVARNSGKLNNIHIKGEITLNAGTNARYIGALAGWNNGTIANCSITGEGEMIINVNHTASQTVNVGGLTGYSQKGISNCKIEKTGGISVSGGSTSTAFIGGFIGNHITDGSIVNCLTNLNLNITKTNNIYAGGFIGQGTRALAHCTATGTLSFEEISNANTQSVNIGGFIGMMDNNNSDPTSLLDCAFTGSIKGTFPSGAHVGGLAGTINSTQEDAKIERSFAAGTLPDSNAAGLVGYINPDNMHATSISNSFCIEGSPFVVSTGTDKCTITSCHINGKVPDTEKTFTPSEESKSYWRNDPPIYGQGIYYLIRGTK